jgi:lipopolysaccharide biosynthesis protein
MKVIAFNLPQFHPVPENDTWWGKGFTEWTNVTRARPVVPGHPQPHLPADLGFYDLRLPEARAAQAELAQAYGVDGFCYYHYWFTGRRILQRPVDEIVRLGEPDFPFCVCWANENWSRAWDGSARELLLQQHYSDADDLAHIQHLLPILADRRYIRVGGRPLLLVYRTEELPDPRRTADLWRNEAVRAGVGDLCLARVEGSKDGIDPASIGFDLAIEFAPDWRRAKAKYFNRGYRLLSQLGLFPKGYFEHNFVEYADLVQNMLAKQQPPYRRVRCVTPGFDNSARRRKDATIFQNSTPDQYQRWLETTLRAERALQLPADESLVFVNAWNEWAEGNHLEPCQRWGRAYLDAHKAAVSAAAGTSG